MTVHELEHRMTAAEFYEWAEYYSIEPFGAPWEDLRNAWTIANVAAMAGAKSVDVENFLLMGRDSDERPERGKPQSLWTQDDWARWVNMFFGIKYAQQQGQG